MFNSLNISLRDQKIKMHPYKRISATKKTNQIKNTNSTKIESNNYNKRLED